ncbi:MAG: hypothetical protein GX594_17190 [Pirellulaceae bacterium]|nr:hypothetical protein [Pirellulaceae bacterium]
MQWNKPTHELLADTARLLYTGYKNAADDYRLNPSVINGQSCEAYCIALQNLAGGVVKLLPGLWPDLRLVARGGMWHTQPQFDWDAAEVELRKIEAAAETAADQPKAAVAPPVELPTADMIPAKKASVEARMYDLIRRDSSTYTWTVREFAEKLECSVGAVAATSVWRELRTAREMARLDRSQVNNTR